MKVQFENGAFSLVKAELKLTSIFCLHDSIPPHTTNHTQDLLDSFKWEIFYELPYRPLLAPSDYRLLEKKDGMQYIALITTRSQNCMSPSD